MIVDIHSHIWPEVGAIPRRHVWATAVHWGCVRLPGEPRDPNLIVDRIAPGWVDPQAEYNLKNNAEAGIDVAVLNTIDYGLSMGEEQEFTIEQFIERLASLQEKHPGKLIAFASPDPRRAGALDLFKRAVDQYGFKGMGEVCLHAGFYANDPILYPFYEMCAERGLPVLLCTMNQFGGHHRLRINDPLYIGDVVADFPDLNIILAHTGWPYRHWFEVCQMVAGVAKNVYLQFDLWLSGVTMSTHGGGWPSLRNNERTIVEMLVQAKENVGAQRMMFGSDSTPGPRWDGPTSTYGFGLKRLVDWWKALPETAEKYGAQFTQEEVDLILGGNAARVLGLEPTPEGLKPRYGWQIRYPRPHS